MYLNILKRDLKRKKTMNVILLLFIILATTFVSSSANNLLTVTTALDGYFELAEMPDYFVATIDRGNNAIIKILDNEPKVDSYGVEQILYMTFDNIIYNDEDFDGVQGATALMSFEDAQINYFDKNNKIIEEVEEGTIVISAKFMNKFDIKSGDTLKIKLENVTKSFKVAGSFKDAMMGSEMTSIIRFIVNDKDYQDFASVDEIKNQYTGSFCYIETNDCKAVEKVVNEQSNNTIFLGDMNLIKTTYIMDMIVAGVLLIISICLIMISFVMLGFTITFTMSEEYREIGIMKAIGIRCTKIRVLYLIKYLALAIIGVTIGFFTSIPFGDMLLGSVSATIVLINSSGNLINLICSVLVASIILIFCFICTGKVKKFTPVDAIRNGETGERYKKKGLFSLNKLSIKPNVFLTLNDVFSNPRRYGMIILIFTLSLSLVLVLVNTSNTLKSDSLITTLGLTKSDVYFIKDEGQMNFMSEDGREKLLDELDSIEKKLGDNGIPCEAIYENMFKITLKHGDNLYKSIVLQGVNTTTDQYEYFEGTAPKNTNEVAITPLIAEKLNVEIGDTIIMSQIEGENEYIVTALFQSMTNLGEGVRLHEDLDISFAQSSGFFAFQVNFTDNPDKDEIVNRIEKIKDIYNTTRVYTASEFINVLTGTFTVVDSVKYLVLAIMIIIVILVTILMERSFIIKERSEIALLKSIGFKNTTLITWHTLRFALITIISAIISIATIVPFTHLTVGPIFSFMGAKNGMQYEIVPLEIFAIYPIIILTVVMIGAFITAQHIRSISASEISGTE